MTNIMACSLTAAKALDPENSEESKLEAERLAKSRSSCPKRKGRKHGPRTRLKAVHRCP